MSTVNCELEFLGDPLQNLTDDHLPTLGEMFRYYHHCRQNIGVNKSPRFSAYSTVDRCIKIWDKFGIRTALVHNLTKIFLRLYYLFKSIFYHSNGGIRKKRKEILWRRKVNLVFNAAAKDALKKCRSWKKKRILRAIQKSAKELQEMERKIDVRKGLDCAEIDEVKDTEKNVVNDVSLRRKVKSEENARNSLKKCTVVLSKMEIITDSEDAFKVKEDPEPFNVSQQISELTEDEDVVPPNLPAIIVKEEVDFTWDDDDNMSPIKDDNYAQSSFEKDSTFYAKFDLHRFASSDNDTTNV